MTLAVMERGTFGPVSDEVEVEGAWIRERREELGLSISELAKRAGVDRGQLSDIEKGNVRPRGVTLSQIRRALSEFGEEVSGPYDGGGDHTITFRMSGNFGVDVTVSGPVENLSELEASVGRLLQQMRSNDQT